MLRLNKDLLRRSPRFTTGLRNRLVHGYEKVEHQIVHRSLKSLIRDYRQYLVKMNDYVQFDKSV